MKKTAFSTLVLVTFILHPEIIKMGVVSIEVSSIGMIKFTEFMQAGCRHPGSHHVLPKE